MKSVRVLLIAVAMLAVSCSSGTADTTIPPHPTATAAEVTSTLPATTTPAATSTAAAPAPLETMYPVVMTTGLSGEDTQEVTVWAPDADGSWPVVYALHGITGSAQDLAEFATVLAGQGVVVFATDYRSELMQTEEWKDAYRDTECGYRYARSVAADYGGDLDHPVTIVGHSLGATMALSMGLNESVFGPDGEFDSCPGETPRPDVVVPLSGCHYEYEGRTFAFDPVVWNLTYDESELVLVVGTEDDVCEAWQSEDAATALRDDGFDTSLVTIDGGNHFTVIFHDIVDDQWLTLPDDPVGMEVVQTILEAIDAAGTDDESPFAAPAVYEQKARDYCSAWPDVAGLLSEDANFAEVPGDGLAVPDRGGFAKGISEDVVQGHDAVVAAVADTGLSTVDCGGPVTVSGDWVAVPVSASKADGSGVEGIWVFRIVKGQVQWHLAYGTEVAAVTAASTDPDAGLVADARDFCAIVEGTGYTRDGDEFLAAMTDDPLVHIYPEGLYWTGVDEVGSMVTQTPTSEDISCGDDITTNGQWSAEVMTVDLPQAAQVGVMVRHHVDEKKHSQFIHFTRTSGYVWGLPLDE